MDIYQKEQLKIELENDFSLQQIEKIITIIERENSLAIEQAEADEDNTWEKGYREGFNEGISQCEDVY